MPEKPTYQELEQSIRDLENEAEKRKLTEDALRKNEEQYRSIFENNPIETITVDREARVTGYNLARQRVGDRLHHIGDVMYKDYATRHNIDIYRELMECIESGVSKEFPEQKYKDRYLYIRMSPFHGGAIITSRDITAGKLAEEERERLIQELTNALATVKKLSGLLPICSSCKKIRDDKGYWKRIEEYIRDHSEADFSHGICPECARRLYPDLVKEG